MMNFTKFKDFFDRTPGSGALGLQVFSGQEKKILFEQLEVSL